MKTADVFSVFWEAPGLEFSLTFQPGFYYIFAGTSEENPSLTINYVDDATGNTLAASKRQKDKPHSA